MTGIQFLAGAENFSICHHVQTSSGVHPASYSMGIRGKAAVASSWPLTSI